MTNPGSTRLRSPLCPRCGYDQSGQCELWRDRCPVRGRCPECGHDFAWADLFDPSRRDIRWHVEHARSLRSLALRTVPTLLCMIWPGWFWSRTGVDARSRPARFVQASALVLVVGSLLAAIPMAALHGLDRTRTGWAVIDPSNYIQTLTVNAATVDLASGLVLPFQVFQDDWARYPTVMSLSLSAQDAMAMLLLPVATSTMWLILMCVLPWTRRRARLRAGHLWRAWLGAILPLTAAFVLWRVLATAEIVYLAEVGPWTALFVLALWAWVLLWWACALWFGWRVRAVLLHLTGAIAALLGGFILTLSTIWGIRSLL